MEHEVGRTKITKADANAKTIYIHTFQYDKANQTLKPTQNYFRLMKPLMKVRA